MFLCKIIFGVLVLYKLLFVHCGQYPPNCTPELKAAIDEIHNRDRMQQQKLLQELDASTKAMLERIQAQEEEAERKRREEEERSSLELIEKLKQDEDILEEQPEELYDEKTIDLLEEWRQKGEIDVPAEITDFKTLGRSRITVSRVSSPGLRPRLIGSYSDSPLRRRGGLADVTRPVTLPWSLGGVGGLSRTDSSPSSVRGASGGVGGLSRIVSSRNATSGGGPRDSNMRTAPGTGSSTPTRSADTSNTLAEPFGDLRAVSGEDEDQAYISVREESLKVTHGPVASSSAVEGADDVEYKRALEESLRVTRGPVGGWGNDEEELKRALEESLKVANDECRRRAIAAEQFLRAIEESEQLAGMQGVGSAPKTVHGEPCRPVITMMQSPKSTSEILTNNLMDVVMKSIGKDLFVFILADHTYTPFPFVGDDKYINAAECFIILVKEKDNDELKNEFMWNVYYIIGEESESDTHPETAEYGLSFHHRLRKHQKSFLYRWVDKFHPKIPLTDVEEYFTKKMRFELYLVTSDGQAKRIPLNSDLLTPYSCAILIVLRPKLKVQEYCGESATPNAKEKSKKIVLFASQGLDVTETCKNGKKGLKTTLGNAANGQKPKESQEPPALFKFVGEDTEGVAEEMPQSFSLLDEYAAYLLDSKNYGGLFVWIGKFCELGIQRRAVMRLEDYITINKLDVTAYGAVMVQGTETVGFVINFEEGL